ncbi:MAG: ComF family protein [Armatimonadetes bacterium]|nr:ComF family protein [Armatimonadota bacterium]
MQIAECRMTYDWEVPSFFILHSSFCIAMLLKLARDIYTGLLDLIYPPFCLVCEKPGEEALCAECIEKIDLVGRACCHKCGAPTEEYECRDCRERVFAFEYARSAAIFEGVLRDAIHRLKYDSRLALADPLAELMVRCFPDTTLPGKVDLIIPIPIHPSRMPERGFNQAKELAARFCKRVRLPIATDVLLKTKKTAHQVDLARDERGINLEGAFVARNADKISGKRILLIDDVFTTGSTLHEAATVLMQVGAKAVYAYTLARSI